MIYCSSACFTRKTWTSIDGSTSSHVLGSGHAGPGLSESNPMSAKMKPSGVHMQTHVYRVMCRMLKSYKYRLITTNQCNMKSVLSQKNAIRLLYYY